MKVTKIATLLRKTRFRIIDWNFRYMALRYLAAHACVNIRADVKLSRTNFKIAKRFVATPNCSLNAAQAAFEESF